MRNGLGQWCPRLQIGFGRGDTRPVGVHVRGADGTAANLTDDPFIEILNR